jgi:hypothetical protein
MSDQSQNEQGAAPSELSDASMESVAGGCPGPIIDIIDIIDVTNGPDVAF